MPSQDLASTGPSNGGVFRQRLQYLLISILAVLLIVGVLSFISLLRLKAYAEQVGHTLDVREVAVAVLDDAQDAETGQRGFILTGRPEYLQPFRAAESQVKTNLDRLIALTSNDSAQNERARAVERDVNTKFAELRTTIELVQQGRIEEARAIVNGGQGRSTMENIRAELATLKTTERSTLDAKRAQAGNERNFLLALIVIAFLATVAMAATIWTTTRSFVAGLAKETQTRQEAEATLRQAQKMEAVGQLSGGIAHDFNNLLTIIMGNLDTLKRRTANATRDQEAQHLAATLAKPIDMALQGARSAAQLTQRLLAFSRRQPLNPARIDANQLVAGISELVRRTVGETVAVEAVLAGGLWPAFVDAHQLESALVNLVVNARDAMPDGGRITIETANAYLDDAYAARFGDVTAGQYVMLSVSDNGHGMPRDILNRAFEPFFTTKDTGKGTGLGLAMVHGFVKQSGGHVRIYSEVGVGTTVKLYLRRLTKADEVAAAPAGRTQTVVEAVRAKPGETILLVEDNTDVREYAVDVLEDMGYRVIEASDGVAALQALEAADRVDLLFTDVVLPGGMNGRLLADRITAARPGLPVLYTTGYTRNAIVHNGQLDTDVQLLNKPYTQQELTRKVRELLDKTDR